MKENSRHKLRESFFIIFVIWQQIFPRVLVVMMIRAMIDETAVITTHSGGRRVAHLTAVVCGAACGKLFQLGAMLHEHILRHYSRVPLRPRIN